ncbi:biotin carboxyl carrier protein of acetyl-CoA carboxylase 1, chloroplastic-like [Nicotiana tomentosiformis]|uniref:biotin carboxyl carrier protein of acetyl-CoA carboxylase 1, chloroplastic-like n=1 Tax=Nicotiana tomentosiformis TaxID=4098 RepID=UPI00051BF963|nr:biotin carboxyl carrier protein of acetyl-CoA carboxylase 1, chloroplastic-like [Nicotiana tomentosiformis]
MASFSVPCPKIFVLSVASSHSSSTQQPHVSVSLRSTPALLPRLQGSSRLQSQVFKVNAQLNEVAIDKSTNSKPVSEKSLEEVPKTEYSIPDASSIQAFMSQAADLVELVDSRDIVELQLKQKDCEILIRKKAALPQPPVVMAPPSVQQGFYQPQLPPASAPAPAAPVAPAAPALLPPAPSKPKSSHPPMKCPMAGTFYRSPAPGAPPFVKVGDKVQKGQVVCIIEAMKLMNEIEADSSGTIVDIIADDGKPVSVDTPLFVIEP